MRPEWARAMGEGAINAMNHKAKYGGFADGGIFRPINEPVSRGLHDQYTGYPAVDLAAPVGMPVFAVAGGTITRSYDIAGPLSSDSYHNAAYGPYGSYGRVMYLKTDMGPEVLYAHLSKRGMALECTCLPVMSSVPLAPLVTPLARTCTSVTTTGTHTSSSSTPTPVMGCSQVPQSAGLV
jgi:hypothetical protein